MWNNLIRGDLLVDDVDANARFVVVKNGEGETGSRYLEQQLKGKINH